MTTAVLDRGVTPVAEAPVVHPHGGPGRTRITAKALEHVAVNIAAESLGVPAGRVKVDLADDRGALALIVTSPMSAIPLARVSATPEAFQRSGGSIVERVSAATTAIAARVEQLSGSHVSRVSIRVSGLEIDQEGRIS
ncbi:hypothetical protein ITJ57_04820 [Plantibacter sp. VKM Ac-2880]|uniref:hypothetical protein n=1 Tax=Plantibacter sp. VKM Ac-2880 TaxID=2783827 RepID=UPI00188F8729|nr:hypothetical protein [Plantibacter sp. VKM Ac-2880]MBF4568087.1 hypothetical protein [Plantibacter sp. VKM Ac-2880]